MDDQESELEKFGQAALEAVAQVAEPLLNKKLAALGVSSPQELPPAVRKEIFLEAFREAAPLALPGVDTEKLIRGFENFTDQSFMNSHRAMRESDEPSDAFQPAIGKSAALVMAGIGLPVAPFDPVSCTLVAPYSRDLSEVEVAFGATDEFVVCYNSAQATFYSLQTDCLKTLSARVNYHKAALPVRRLLKRAHFDLPKKKASFVHFAMLFPRRQGDRIPSVAMLDDSPTRGSILLNAGWVDEDGNICGAPVDGRASVPASLVRRVTLDPQLAFWLTEPHDQPPITLH